MRFSLVSILLLTLLAPFFGVVYAAPQVYASSGEGSGPTVTPTLPP